MTSVNTRAAEVARDSYGKLVAILSSEGGDIMAAEDALADAFRKALESWGESGIPDNPEAWLLTVSRNAIRDRYRSADQRRRAEQEDYEFDMMHSTIDDIDPESIPDERLKLLFVCAHPAIDAGIRTPLMLQSVLGFEAEQIGLAFLVPGSTMAQRLVRAKRKVKEANIPFVLPRAEDMAERIEAVLEAIYGVYAIGSDQPMAIGEHEDVAAEALFLADMVVELLPGEAEVLGLAALLSYSFARRESRFAERDVYVPLDQQDMALWDRMRIARGDALLGRAQELGVLGRFQLEAAIQSVHCTRLESGVTDWAAVGQLYTGLLQIAPTIGAAVGRAAALGQAFGAEAGLDALGVIAKEDCRRFQPYWATRAHLLAMGKDVKAAGAAYRKAIDLTTDIPVRRYLEGRLVAVVQA